MVTNALCRKQIVVFVLFPLFNFMCSHGDSGNVKGPVSLSPNPDLIFGNGINMDASVQGTDVKYQHQPEYFDAVVDAGFQTVRWFIDPTADPEHWQNMINQAIERDLIVVVVLWPDRNWSAKNFSAYWEKFAIYYQDYPRDKLIFELFNEPEAVGLIEGDLSMEWINTAIPAIRKSSPDRLLAIGGPGFNEAENLIQFVNPSYLNYRLNDGSGFENDENIVGVFHMYLPYYFSHYHSTPLRSDWKEIVTDKLELADSWSEKWHKPILLTEWGAWGPPANLKEDFHRYLEHIVNETARLEIEWIYYCGFMNNQWPFSIFNTNTGWDLSVLSILTGRAPVVRLSLSPLLNSEFNYGTTQWKTRGGVELSHVSTAELSGDSALEIKFTDDPLASVFQENLGTELGRKEWSEGGRSLISVTTGNTYLISFLAKSVSGNGLIKISVEEVSTGRTVWISESITLSTEPKGYEVPFIPTQDINGLRFVISSDSTFQRLYIDRIQFKRL
ncbi:MAG: hypothetical protein CME10_12940 [Gemmatimonadetes bacterium]|nr:hypothetical protein [Gemmatimonadota bacterium]